VGAVAVYVLNDELLVIQSEQKNGMLRPASYIIMAKVILTLPFIFVFAIFTLGVSPWLGDPELSNIALDCSNFTLVYSRLFLRVACGMLGNLGQG
jgi:hypothetical protein